MRIISFALLCNLCFSNGGAQVIHWEQAGLPLTGWQIRCTYVDTVMNKLYVGGGILRTVNVFDSLSICLYDGSSWDTLGNFNNQQLCITKFNNDLIVGGFFTTVNGVPVHYIARYDGTSWHALGNFNQSVLRVKVIDGELYAAGLFDTVDALPIHGIAKWTGTQWTDVHAFPWNPFSAISDFTMYNNELYVAGDFNIGGVEDMMYYHNGSWQVVGQGFTGFFNWVDKLEVLNGELYAGGSISLTDGNVGNGIQKWNGTSWSQVGNNLQDMNNSYANRIEVFDMTLHDNELYCVGLLEYAGHVPAKYLAKWTGSQWCGFGTGSEFDMVAYQIAVFNDTMFIGGGIDTINGVSTEYLIKWIGGNYIDSCSAPDGINENEFFSEFYCYPNPSEKSLTINFPFIIDNFELAITDVLGKKHREEIFSPNVSKKEYDISDLAPGIYFVTLQSEGFRTTRKIIKQ